MSYQEDFELWKEQIENLPSNEVKLPNQPIDVFAAQTETLATEAAKDKEALSHAGLDVTIIDDLIPLTGALRYLQANWMSEYRARQDAQKEWNEQSPHAYELRKELLHHFSFAYRNDPDLMKKVRRIREGAGHADMIQDLVEIAVLGEKNVQPLTNINLDIQLLQEARTVSHAMAELLALANGASDATSGNKELRDKAFTLLYNKVKTIRDYGRYVFWQDDNRKAKYLLGQ